MMVKDGEIQFNVGDRVVDNEGDNGKGTVTEVLPRIGFYKVVWERGNCGIHRAWCLGMAFGN